MELPDPPEEWSQQVVAKEPDFPSFPHSLVHLSERFYIVDSHARVGLSVGREWETGQRSRTSLTKVLRRQVCNR